ncbi:MAG: hypothetical protein ACTSXG_03935 [Alphaproteobacteria bacterium]
MFFIVVARFFLIWSIWIGIGYYVAVIYFFFLYQTIYSEVLVEGFKLSYFGRFYFVRCLSNKEMVV